MDIDDSGFELGMPSHQELLEQQCDMLCNENDELRRDLMNAKRNIEKLVEINADLTARLRTLQLQKNGGYGEGQRRRHSVGTWGMIGNLMTPEEAASIQERMSGAAGKAFPISDI
ncbi:hypothetical protein E2H86_10785 [Pseudomonas putida]|uniref:hypothetical protein n=1 Tax=Pseudomonas putida TaxID=303 RepID=UPI001059AB5B|nr:hypothetical protein [Pseudomonas putida]TDJ76951.1 hypothetical protein E2H86_10785 [Pseudomonas putida]